MFVSRHLCWVSAVALAACGCTDDGVPPEDEVPECISYSLDGCSLLYPPSYDQVWNQTLANTCGSTGTSCHAQDDAAGAVNGMTFIDPLVTWDHLTTGDEDGPLVVAGDPECSRLFVRLATDNPAIRMPPGEAPLPPNTLCSIGTWISDGASFTQP